MSPTSGTVSAGGSEDVEISLTGVEIGIFGASLIISSNDPDESTVSIPVSMTVNSFGCMDVSACNYDETATEDDGSCIDPAFDCANGDVVCSEEECPVDISVTPGQIDETFSSAGDSSTHTVSIANEGNNDLEWFMSVQGQSREGAHTFTTCGQSGRYGPSQSQCDSEYLGTGLESQVTLNGGIQEWVVPFTGVYTIEALSLIHI